MNRLVRQIHYWTSIAALMATGLVAMTGVLLLFKKDFDYLQPKVIAASSIGPSRASVLELHSVAINHPSAAGHQIDRIDIRPADGVAKVITDKRLELQLDLHTLEVLSVQLRTSDLLEQLHDGSFFSPWVKYGIMLPSGLALLILWATGIYLFVLPRMRRNAKRRTSDAHGQTPWPRK